MDQELLHLLSNWKKSEENYFGALRNVRYCHSFIAEGEYIVSIESVITVNKQTISLKRTFFTFAQSDRPYILNKKGDIYNLKQFLKSFDEDFNKEVQARLNDGFDDLEDSAFLEL